MLTLDGKTVLVTGAAQRVGRSLAQAIAEAGGNVVIHYLHSQAEAESLRSEIRALGRQAHLLQAELSDPEQAAGLIGRALAFGPLYALINNASIFEPISWTQTQLEDWNRHLAVNLTAPFLLSQAFARTLPETENGRIINLLDWRAMQPGADHLPYTISKAALAALTRSLAIAFAPRISVNGLALGAILPPKGSETSDDILSKVPARRWAKLEEVDQAILFLLAGPAYITGEVIHIDGGRHLG